MDTEKGKRPRSSYHDVDHGSHGDGPEPSGVGIGDEGSQQGCQASRSREVGEGVCRLRQRQVELLRQVAYHVHVEPDHCQLIAGLVRCRLKYQLQEPEN